MRRYVRLTTVKLLICLGYVWLGGVTQISAQESAAVAEAAVAVGEEAPDFTVNTRDGEFRLSDHRGEFVVIAFVRAHW